MNTINLTAKQAEVLTRAINRLIGAQRELKEAEGALKDLEIAFGGRLEQTETEQGPGLVLVATPEEGTEAGDEEGTERVLKFPQRDTPEEAPMETL